MPPLGGHEPSTSRLPKTGQMTLLGGLEPSTSRLPKTGQMPTPPTVALAAERAPVLEWVPVAAPEAERSIAECSPPSGYRCRVALRGVPMIVVGGE